MTTQRFDDYLTALRRELRRRGVAPARIVAETQEHLVDAAAEGCGRGLSGADADRLAMERFGDPAVIAARFSTERYRPLSRLLQLNCLATLAGTGLLSLSVAVLRPPRVNMMAWAVAASLIAAQSGWTLAMLASGAGPRWVRNLTGLGGVALAAAGANWACATMTGPHFEGYALLLGSSMAVQGGLTLWRVAHEPRLLMPRR